MLIWFCIGALTTAQALALVLWWLAFRQLRLLADCVLQLQHRVDALEPKNTCSVTVELGILTNAPPPPNLRAN